MQNHGRVFEAAEARTGTSCLKPHSSVTGIIKSTLSERDESIIFLKKNPTWKGNIEVLYLLC